MKFKFKIVLLMALLLVGFIGILYSDGVNSQGKFKNLPRIQLLFPSANEKISEDAENISIGFSVKDTGGGISKVEVFCQNRLAHTITSGFDKHWIKLSVPVMPGTNHISIKAYNKGNMSRTYQYVFEKEISADTPKPDLYVLSIGINRYHFDEHYYLNYAVQNANRVADVFKTYSSSLFNVINLTVLTEENVIKSNVLRVFDSIQKKAKPQDVVVLYLTGLSFLNQDDEFYFALSDLPKRDNHGDLLEQFGITSQNLKDWIGEIRASKVVLILDTNYAGSTVDVLPGVFVLASSSKYQHSYEVYNLCSSTFTWVLLNGIRGYTDICGVKEKSIANADFDKDGFITISELGFYVIQNFDKQTEPYRNTNTIQKPIILKRYGRDSAGDAVNDFPIVKVKK